MDYGKELMRYVDDGALQWKIGSVEKLCSVIAGKHAVTLIFQYPSSELIQGVSEGLKIARQRLKELNVFFPANPNLAFHLKTGEVFLWFGEKHDLTKIQLMEAIEFVESVCEREVINLIRTQDPESIETSSRQESITKQRSKALEYLTMIQANSPGQSKRMLENSFLSILSQSEENWQEVAHHLGFDISTDMVQRLKDIKKQHFANSASDAKEKVPETQSLIDFLTMEETKADFDRIILDKFENADQYRTSEKVFFGTLETEELNALITKVPYSEEYLIIINRGLWEVAKLLSFTLAGTVFNEMGMPRRFNPQTAEPYVSVFVVNVAAMLNNSDVAKQIPRLEIGTFPEFYWLHLDRSIHDFLMGHEYGHFLRGHFADNSHLTVHHLGAMDILQNTTSWENEYEADRVGLDLAIFRARELFSQEATKLDLLKQNMMAFIMTLGLLGCWACLHLLWRMERARGVIYDAEASHPPTPLRIATMLRVILNQMPDEKTANSVLEQLKNVAQCITILFEYVSSKVTPTDSSHLEKLELEFQNVVFQSILFNRHEEIIAALKAMIPSFQPPYPALKTIDVIEKNQLLFRGYKMLSEALWYQNAAWKEYVSIIEKSILILEKNFIVLTGS